MCFVLKITGKVRRTLGHLYLLKSQLRSYLLSFQDSGIFRDDFKNWKIINP